VTRSLILQAKESTCYSLLPQKPFTNDALATTPQSTASPRSYARSVVWGFCGRKICYVICRSIPRRKISFAGPMAVGGSSLGPTTAVAMRRSIIQASLSLRDHPNLVFNPHTRTGIRTSAALALLALSNRELASRSANSLSIILPPILASSDPLASILASEVLSLNRDCSTSTSRSFPKMLTTQRRFDILLFPHADPRNVFTRSFCFHTPARIRIMSSVACVMNDKRARRFW